MNKRIGVIDYGVGNIGSIVNIVNKAGFEIDVISNSSELSKYQIIILPGVGAFDFAMQVLEADGWIKALNEYVKNYNNKILGICLGMQILTRGSEEGLHKGLSFINAYAVKFDIEKMSTRNKVPNMGWRTVNVKKNGQLFIKDNIEKKFYFVHSYHVVCDNESDVLTTSNYGYDFVSSFQCKNITGVQFHPEKSHKFGLNFFKNYLSSVSN